MQPHSTDNLIDSLHDATASEGAPSGIRPDLDHNGIPDIVIRRMPIYARSLDYLASEGVETVSSGELGMRLGVSAAQIAKRTSIDRPTVNAALAVTKADQSRNRLDSGDHRILQRPQHRRGTGGAAEGSGWPDGSALACSRASDSILSTSRSLQADAELLIVVPRRPGPVVDHRDDRGTWLSRTASPACRCCFLERLRNSARSARSPRA